MKQLLAIQLPCLWSTPVKSSTLRMSHQLYPMLFYWCFVWCRELTLMNICIDTSKKKNVWEKKMKWFIASTGNCSVWALMTIRKRGRRFPAVISPLLGDVDVVDGFWFDCLPTPKLTEVWSLIQTSPGLLPLGCFSNILSMCGVSCLNGMSDVTTDCEILFQKTPGKFFGYLIWLSNYPAIYWC